MMNTEDIKKELQRKYKEGDFRVLYNGTVKTIEIQNAHFIADKDYIIRKPNYEYAEREIEWYMKQSLYVDDIPEGAPKIWKDCADKEGKINSNYGWCIFSNENGNQFRSCINTLVNDPYSRQAVMIYNRPSMQIDANENGRHDFMCTYAVQCFLNDKVDDSIPGTLEPYYELKYIVYMRSNDAVFGYDNDYLWHKFVQDKICEELSEKLKYPVSAGDIEWNAGSFHVYERHFKFLE